eukprot:g2649.t1
MDSVEIRSLDSEDLSCDEGTEMNEDSFDSDRDKMRLPLIRLKLNSRPKNKVPDRPVVIGIFAIKISITIWIMLKLRTLCCSRVRSVCPGHWTVRAYPDRSLYESLGVSVEATREQVLLAYSQILNSLRNEVSSKSAARRHYASACVAYEVLSNTEMRKLYNVEGLSALPKKYVSLLEFLNYENEVNEDGTVRTVHCISLELAIFGGSTEVVVKTRQSCTSCYGKNDVTTCVACEGSGSVMITSSEHPLGIKGTCPVCGGDGFEIRSFCRMCRGKGEIEIQKKIHFTVPPGVETGTVLKLSGFGSNSVHSSSKTGDVLIGLIVHRNSTYRKSGNDIYSSVLVPYTVAILGGNITVSTIWGTNFLQIPPGVQHGQQIVLEGQGVKNDSICGNHVFEVKVSLPTSVTSETMDLLERLSALDHY